MRKLVAVFAAFSFLHAAGQTGSAAVSSRETDSLFASYYITGQDTYAPLYNGRQFYGYPSSIEGTSFYGPKEWNIGSVLYDGIWYRNIPLMYDAYRDEVVIRHPNGIPIVLYTERVKQFDLEGLTFINLKNEGDSAKTGFFQELLRGKVVLYAKRIKKLDEKIDGMVVERKFLPADVFFIYKDNGYDRVKNQQALFDILKEKRQAIQQFRRQNGLKYKPGPEQFIYRITEYYNQINP